MSEPFDVEDYIRRAPQRRPRFTEADLRIVAERVAAESARHRLPEPAHLARGVDYLVAQLRAGPNPACHWCGGSGIGGEVCWEMASDAGEPSMEGQPIPCQCVPAHKPNPSEVPF